MLICIWHHADAGGAKLQGHLTTFEAAVHGFGSAGELARVRREIKKEYPVEDKRLGPPLKAKSGPFYDARVGR